MDAIESKRPVHYVDPDTPIYEQTCRALGFVPTPPQEPVVVMVEMPAAALPLPAAPSGVDERTIIEQVEIPARPVGAAAVLAITEPTGVLPRPKKQPAKKPAKQVKRIRTNGKLEGK